jgi:hypothetical protein
MAMPRVVHIDLSADDPRRAVEFYRNVFGWKVEKWAGADEYWLLLTGDAQNPGITCGIARRVSPGDSTAAVYDVTSVDGAAARVLAFGGSIREPKRSLPGVGQLLACRDIEGNTFCLLQPEPSAVVAGDRR